jgi:glutamyl-tRNA reductase
VKILLVGMNHVSAPVEVRERYAVGDLEGALAKLVSYDEIDEAVVVSTCNRVELVVTTHRPSDARHTLARFFERELAVEDSVPSLQGLGDHVYTYAEREAVAHVFRVASSIDSMVVGEPQILGQVKDAYRAAVEQGACGAILSRLFQRAFATAKRVKNETGIAQRPVSVARVAVDLAQQIFEEFEDKKALLIGAGEMTELAMDALCREGLRDVRVANRTRAHAEALAARFGASAHGLDELDEQLASADLVLTSIGGDRPLIDRARVSAAMEGRPRRPIFFIDMGVPRNVDPEVDRLDSVYLYDIDDLQGVSYENVEERRREASRAEQIVQEEQQRFDGWLVVLQAVPTIRNLRDFAESIRSAETEKILGRIEQGEDPREAVERVTRSIVNKILHPPLARLRAETDREEGIAMLEAARALFALDEAQDRAERAPGAAVDSENENENEDEDEDVAGGDSPA